MVLHDSLSLFNEPPPGKGTARDAQLRHLKAARRLSKRIARLPDPSPEHQRTGRLICRHLVAMLKVAQAQSSATPHRSVVDAELTPHRSVALRS
jgi:hypothetical protein